MSIGLLRPHDRPRAWPWGVVATICLAGCLSPQTSGDADPDADKAGKTTLAEFMGVNVFEVDFAAMGPVEVATVTAIEPVAHRVRFFQMWAYHAVGAPAYPNDHIAFAPNNVGGLNWDVLAQAFTARGMTFHPALMGIPGWMVGRTNPNKDAEALWELKEWHPAANAAGQWMDACFSAAARTSEACADPQLYAAHAHAMYQWAARYGEVAVDHSLLRLAPGQPKASGLGAASYFENMNEPDKRWAEDRTKFSPEQLAAMSSADYDGHLGTLIGPGGQPVGVKSADPGAKLVLAGLAGCDPDVEDGGGCSNRLGAWDGAMIKWFDRIKAWSDLYRAGSFPADVLNVHTYGMDIAGPEAGPRSPEADQLREKLARIVAWRDANVPGKEIWLTEFGYENDPGTGYAGPLVVPDIAGVASEVVQAQWITRAMLLAAASGIDRAYLYWMADRKPGQGSGWLFDYAALMRWDGAAYVPKAAYYWLATLRHRLGTFAYERDVELPGAPSDVVALEFRDASTGKTALVAWVGSAAAGNRRGGDSAEQRHRRGQVWL